MSQSVKFNIPWKITSEQFAALPTTKIEKNFITSLGNVPLKWRAQLAITRRNTVSFDVIEDNGTLPALKLLGYKLSARKPDGTYQLFVMGTMMALGTAPHGRCHRIEVDETANFDMTHFSAYQITLKIPTSMFREYEGFKPKTEVPRYGDGSWMFDQIENIKDRDQIKYSDVTLISADDISFYCHRVILATQSKGFDALFRNPLTEETQQGIFRLPTVAGNVLEIVLRHLYTYHVDLSALNVPFANTIELANFAEQYGLKDLKEACIFYLWKNIEKNLEECVDLIRFADLHDDMKRLKDRAFDYLVENYDGLSQSVNIFNDAGDQDSRLRTELCSFMSRRVTASFD